MKQVCAKSLVYGLAALAVLMLGINPALALDAKVSGQINQMVMYADDGDQSDVIVADNDSSSTRVRITGVEDFGQVKVGIQFEIEAQRNASNNVTINGNTDGSFTWNDRWFNVYFDTNFGKLEIGKGDTAANGAAEVDLSGTSVVTYSDITASGGALQWRDNNGNLLGGLDIGDTRSNFDGFLSRAERVRYNTPSLGGLVLSASAANGGAWDAALWYAAEFGGNKLAAAIGYVNPQSFGNNSTIDKQWSGSISWLAPFGLNLTAAYGQRDLVADGRDDPVTYYGKIGYKVGIHAFSIEYGVTEDLNANGDKSSNWGAAYVVKPWAPVELYAAYRTYMLDLDASDDPEDIQVGMVGTRVKF